MTDEEKHVSLREMAQRSVELSFDKFDEPDDDIIPELCWRCGYEDKSLGLMALAVDLGVAAERRVITDMMMCHLATQQASEATFANTIWAIEEEDLEDWAAKGKPAPADYERHTEQIFLLHVSPDGEALYRAPITRYPDKPPTLGAWKLEENGRAVGIFRDCLYTGVFMGRNIPDEMAAGLRRDIDKYGPDEVMAGMIRAYRNAEQIAKAQAQ
jgi:hypothetical protein